MRLLPLFLFLLLGACAAPGSISVLRGLDDSPTLSVSPIDERLLAVPELGGPKITIAVYAFNDKTGQRKSSSNSSLSSAVTQGAEVWVIKALQDVGNGSWFEVVERVGIDNLIKERQLIRQTREVYEKGEESGPTPLQPMLFAGLILEGGIVGYDTNTTSGGAGMRYLGLGVGEEYRTDQVTVSLRLVGVQTGEILLTVQVSKTIASTSNGADVFRFLDLGTKALEIESGNAANEPVNYAIRTAIEYAVLQMVYEGKELGLWEWKLPVIEEVQTINTSSIPLDEWAKHPIELKQQGE